MHTHWSEDYVNLWESDELLEKIITDNDYCACVGGGYGTERCSGISVPDNKEDGRQACQEDPKCNWSTSDSPNSQLSLNARHRLEALTQNQYPIMGWGLGKRRDPKTGIVCDNDVELMDDRVQTYYSEDVANYLNYDTRAVDEVITGGKCHSKPPDSWIDGNIGLCRSCLYSV